jgi:RNA polymerase sigma-70 factor, ECF subfamily
VETFEALVERHRGELRVHCYRMLGSYDEAEDLVQETFLRAWKNLDGFEGRSSVRAWLYRIATNACLDALDGARRRVLPHDPGVDAEPVWLQPIPGPDDASVRRETIELAFLAAIQHLPPRQRAVLILRDAAGLRAKETADLLGTSVASANSALQRARVTLRQHLPERRLDWATTTPSDEELAVLRRYLAAVEAADLSTMAELLADEVRTTMPPMRLWLQGREAVLDALATSWDPASAEYLGSFRMVETRANGQPAAAAYVCAPGARSFLPFAIAVLRTEGARIAEITAFQDPGLFGAFGVPDEFPAAPPSQ